MDKTNQRLAVSIKPSIRLKHPTIKRNIIRPHDFKVKLILFLKNAAMIPIRPKNGGINRGNKNSLSFSAKYIIIFKGNAKIAMHNMLVLIILFIAKCFSNLSIFFLIKVKKNENKANVIIYNKYCKIKSEKNNNCKLKKIKKQIIYFQHLTISNQMRLGKEGKYKRNLTSIEKKNIISVDNIPLIL